MKIIEPKVEEVKDFEGVDNFYKAVARAARICYASDKTTDDKALVEILIKSKHFSPFEHAVIFCRNTDEELKGFKYDIISNTRNNKYSVKMSCAFKPSGTTVIPCKDIIYFTAINGRTLIERIIKISDFYEGKIIDLLDSALEVLKGYEIKEDKDNHFFKSFIVDTSIGCTREMNRHHDNFYICEQSTRYCNFSKDKFGNEVAFNKPYWWNDNPPHNYINLSQEEYEQELWKQSMQHAEDMYIKALNNDMPTDIARGILPLDTHTRAIYTAAISEWHHFIDLRFKGTTGKPHGDIKIIAEKINNIINKQ